MGNKFFCPVDRSADCKGSLFKTVQKADAAAHSECLVSGTSNIRSLIVGCRQTQHSHQLLLYKNIRSESKQLFPFPDVVGGRGNSALHSSSKPGSTATVAIVFPQCWTN